MAGVLAFGESTLILALARSLDLGTRDSLLAPASGTLVRERICIKLLMALYFSAMKESPSIW